MPDSKSFTIHIHAKYEKNLRRFWHKILWKERIHKGKKHYAATNIPIIRNFESNVVSVHEENLHLKAKGNCYIRQTKGIS